MKVVSKGCLQLKLKYRDEFYWGSCFPLALLEKMASRASPSRPIPCSVPFVHFSPLETAEQNGAKNKQKGHASREELEASLDVRMWVRVTAHHSHC